MSLSNTKQSRVAKSDLGDHHPSMQETMTTVQTERGPLTWRMVRLEDADDSFDLAFWQSQSAEARFAAAWEMVETAWEMNKRPQHELRLQRTLGRFVPMPG